MCLLPVTTLGVRRSHFFFFSVLSSWSISTVFEFFPFGFLAVCRWVPGTGRAQGRCAEPACCRLQVELGSYALLSPPRWPWQRHSPGSVLTRVSPRLGPSGPHELVESPLALGGLHSSSVSPRNKSCFRNQIPPLGFQSQGRNESLWKRPGGRLCFQVLT